MMNYIWGGIMLISIVCAVFTGRVEAVSQAALDGAKSAVDLLITMLGMMCLWTGLMNIAEQGGVTSMLAKILSPLLKRIFPEYAKDCKTMHAICSNVTANFLGLGNAATPLGLEAMRRMEENNPNKGVANNSMVMFVVLNTASIQLIPTFISVLRKSYGSASPLDILPCIWLSSIFGLFIGILTAKLLEGREKHG
ncbi:MAG: nucleoside recognition domain-containing protein [Bacillota bacterium]|nr:nucleoside recognition domain-containing protein [Bacillota bacterium]